VESEIKVMKSLNLVFIGIAKITFFKEDKFEFGTPTHLGAGGQVPLRVKSEGSYAFGDGGFGFSDHENLQDRIFWTNKIM